MIKRCPQCRTEYRRGGRCPRCNCDLPSKKTIRRRCLALQATWTEADRARHCCGAYLPVAAETAVIARATDHMRRREAEGRD